MRQLQTLENSTSGSRPIFVQQIDDKSDKRFIQNRRADERRKEKGFAKMRPRVDRAQYIRCGVGRVTVKTNVKSK